MVSAAGAQIIIFSQRFFIHRTMLSKKIGDERVEAIAAYVSFSICSVVMTLAYKEIFSEARLHYPWVLQALQILLVVLLLLMHFAYRTQ